ncbi:MAG: PLP-dependent aminotransferase family protein [Proteobacteria bacterium]|nr:PLP-dependent aminotransferase family protein [Pseudomonadota bacterium]MBI3499644.1 PLP-dependent aminotransferase family protein [Pseudomonadota bacterium]
MTSWQPSLSGRPGPRYRAIADALADAVAEGKLQPGDQLPTHRELAQSLGVTVPTVSRAYREAGRRGLLSGQVGRGTFVALANDRRSAAAMVRLREEEAGEIDLDLNQLPAAGEQTAALAEVLAELSGEPGISDLLRYRPNLGLTPHRRSGAAWVAGSGLKAPVERVVLTGGNQHALVIVLRALARPGEVVLCEALAWPGIRRAADFLGLRLEGVAIDAEGLVPDALAEACRRFRPKALYCAPTAQNPTTATMPKARRERIAEIARRFDVAIVEDDVYGPLIEGAPAPLASYAPDHAFYLASLSKGLAAGLRIGYVLAPSAHIGQLAAGVGATTITVAPLMAEIAARWIGDGTAERLLAAQRREIGRRLELATSRLGPGNCRWVRYAAHIWYAVPSPWRPAELAAACQRRGLRVTPSEVFAMAGDERPSGLRLALGGPSSLARLEAALGTFLDVVNAGPGQALGTV